jgi:AGCS family alanine or glycine:cation symporter
VTGGMIGSFLVTLRTGVSRGIFTNEAGMGTASIAHATANEPDPIKQGYMGIIEVFLDTVILCSLTALVILCSGTQVSYGTDTGILLTMNAFAGVFGNWVQVVISALVCVFAFATILGWGLYGMTCAQYLFGKKISSLFLFSEAMVAIIASVTDTAIIWTVSEIINGLMAIPNLVAVMILMPVFLKQIKSVQTL